MAIQDRIELTAEEIEQAGEEFELTAAEFDRLAALPENADRRLEYVGGRIIELVSNNLSSVIAGIIIIEIGIYLKTHNIGWVSVPDGGYMIVGERYIPDVAFMAKTRQAKPSREAYNSIAPDLVVEVLSPSNDADEMRIKVVNYLQAGTVVWVVSPDKKKVQVFGLNQKARSIGIKGTLRGGDVLPGFSIKVADIFAVED